MNRSRAALLVVAVVVVVGAMVLFDGNQGDQDPADEFPRSMAAIGDSITQAAALDAARASDSPEHSWSTGRDDFSHLSRLIEAGASIDPADAHNLAVSGARMEHAPDQARAVVTARASYVTFMLGANDVCAPSPEQMTSVDDFRAHFLASINIIMSRLPDSHLYVVTIPDILYLRDVFEDDERALREWESSGICPNILGPATGGDDLEAARQRLQAFNVVLQEGCEAVRRCSFDGGAVYEHRFTPGDVSPLDFFHPSLQGQATLAEIAWRAGPWSGP